MSRRAARAQALEVLYEAESRHEPREDALRRRADLDPYVSDLVRGVDAHAAEIDELIAGHAHGWEIGHMPPVDRNTLRLALYELLWGGIPPAVAMDEAVELSKKFSSDEAGRFVNGMLAAVTAEMDGLGSDSGSRVDADEAGAGDGSPVELGQET